MCMCVTVSTVCLSLLECIICLAESLSVVTLLYDPLYDVHSGVIFYSYIIL